MGKIDISREEVFPLADLGKAIGRKITYQCAFTWVKNGCTNPNTKEKVKLEAIRMPYGLSTSMEAFGRFVRELNAEPPENGDCPGVGS